MTSDKNTDAPPFSEPKEDPVAEHDGQQDKKSDWLSDLENELNDIMLKWPAL